jgi:hypothetical protein
MSWSNYASLSIGITFWWWFTFPHFCAWLLVYKPFHVLHVFAGSEMGYFCTPQKEHEDTDRPRLRNSFLKYMIPRVPGTSLFLKGEDAGNSTRMAGGVPANPKRFPCCPGPIHTVENPMMKVFHWQISELIMCEEKTSSSCIVWRTSGFDVWTFGHQQIIHPPISTFTLEV